MWILEVIPIKRGFPKETLTYFSAEAVTDGALVSVPIRSKSVDAVVISCKDAREEKAAIKSGSLSLRKITKVKTGENVPDSIFETATLAARYFRVPRGQLLDVLIHDYALYPSLFQNAKEVSDAEEVQPERLIFQSPLTERISYYRTYIRESFAKKESVVFVLPTISDCERWHSLISRGIGEYVVILNSELTQKKLTDLLKRLSTEDHAFVILATPSFLTLMRSDTGTIILENESAGSYIMPSTPGVDMRVLVELLARTARKKFILGDSLVRVETLGRYEAKEFLTLAPVTFRSLVPIDLGIVAHGMPEALPPRLRNEQIPALSEKIYERIAHAQKTKTHVFAFSLRTGLATVTRCRDCGFVLACEFCTAPLVLYTNGETRVYICNKCKEHKPSEAKCLRCGSWNLSALGTGTEFVEAEIRRQFPDMPVFRIDREATPTRAEARKVAALFKASPGGVLVGTEMALYYLHDDVAESVIVSFDTLFNIPSYRTNERIIHLFIQIAERTRGKLYVQTKFADEPIIELIKSNAFMSWYKEELAERKSYGYPPYTTILKLVWHGKEAERDAARDYMKELLAPYSPDIFDSQMVSKGKREASVVAIVRPGSDEWSLYNLMNGKQLSETLRETLSKLPENTIFMVNPENLL